MKKRFELSDYPEHFLDLLKDYRKWESEIVIDDDFLNSVDEFYRRIINQEKIENSCLWEIMWKVDKIFDELWMNKHDLNHVYFTRKMAMAIFLSVIWLWKLSKVDLETEEWKNIVHWIALETITAWFAADFHDIWYLDSVEDEEIREWLKALDKKTFSKILSWKACIKSMFDMHAEIWARKVQYLLKGMFKSWEYKHFLNDSFKEINFDRNKFRQLVAVAIATHSSPKWTDERIMEWELNRSKLLDVSVFLPDKVHIWQRLANNDMVYENMFDIDNKSKKHERVTSVVYWEEFIIRGRKEEIALSLNVDFSLLNKKMKSYFLKNNQEMKGRFKEAEKEYKKWKQIKRGVYYTKEWFLEDFDKVFWKNAEKYSIIARKLFNSSEASFVIKLNFVDDWKIIDSREIKYWASERSREFSERIDAWVDELYEMAMKA